MWTLQSRRRAASVAVLVCAGFLTLVAGGLIPALARSGSPTWPHGVVRVFDDTPSRASIKTAAERWTDSGAKVDIELVSSKREADVVVVQDDRRLLSLCGSDCLGYTTAIGRPSDGHTEVLLRSNLGGTPRPLSVWVAAHELGHVLGLHHQKGKRCSVMSPRAFDTRCAPSLSGTTPTAAELACVPAPRDVDVAAGLYGGSAASDDPRCR